MDNRPVIDYLRATRPCHSAIGQQYRPVKVSIVAQYTAMPLPSPRQPSPTRPGPPCTTRSPVPWQCHGPRARPGPPCRGIATALARGQVPPCRGIATAPARDQVPRAVAVPRPLARDQVPRAVAVPRPSRDLSRGRRLRRRQPQ